MNRRDPKIDYDIVAKLAEKHSANKVAQVTGLSISTVRNLKIETGTRRKGWYWTKREVNYILRHYNNDMTVQEIADHLGRTRYAVINKYHDLKK